MKKLFALFAMMIYALSMLGADIITTKNGKKLEGKVTEITSSEVKYKKASNLNGPTYSLLISDIIKIKYENGEEDVFETTVEGREVSQSGQFVPSSVLSGTTGAYTDSELLKIYETNKKDIYPEVKKLKLTGWIGGSILAAGAVASAIIFNYLCDEPFLIKDCSVPMLAAGAVWTTSFMIAAKNKMKKIDAQHQLQSMSVLKKEFYNHNGKSLDLSVEYIANRINTHALGLGLSYNF